VADKCRVQDSTGKPLCREYCVPGKMYCQKHLAEALARVRGEAPERALTCPQL